MFLEITFISKKSLPLAIREDNAKITINKGKFLICTEKKQL